MSVIGRSSDVGARDPTPTVRSSPCERHPDGMERLERLVIHVEEALRLARYEDEAHLRLALMLLDSAAELILHRAVQTKVDLQYWEAHMLKSYDRAEKA